MMIEIDGLEFHYDEDEGFSLAIPSLRVAKGESIACIGPSGCGKTTFLNLLAGIYPAAGVVVDGARLGELTDRARRRFRATRVGFVFQDFGLLAHLSVRENILLPYYVHPALVPDRSDAALDELAAALGIDGFLHKRPEKLSQGERQRVALARALVTKPALVLADEPTGNLDPERARTAVDLLLAQADRRDATVVMVTHDHGLLEPFDRVVDFAEWRR